MAKANPQQLALAALARALNDPTAKALHGSKMKPGIFDSSSRAARNAAQYCLERGWLEPTGQFDGKSRSRKELYRITPAGIKEALDNAEPVRLLKGAVTSLDDNAALIQDIKAEVEDSLASLQNRVEETLASLQNQKQMVATLLERIHPPDVDRLLRDFRSAAPAEEWLKEALRFLEDYQHRNPVGYCPLPELYHRTAEPRGLSIGQFHDGLQHLVEEEQIRLHPFTGTAAQLREEQYAVVAGREIKYYVERLVAPVTNE